MIARLSPLLMPSNGWLLTINRPSEVRCLSNLTDTQYLLNLSFGITKLALSNKSNNAYISSVDQQCFLESKAQSASEYVSDVCSGTNAQHGGTTATNSPGLCLSSIQLGQSDRSREGCSHGLRIHSWPARKRRSWRRTDNHGLCNQRYGTQHPIHASALRFEN